MRIGALATGIAALVAPAITRLRERRPGLDITVTEAEPPGVFEALDDGDLDIVVAVDYRDAPARSDARYLRRDLLSDPLDVVLPAGHRLATEAAQRRGIRLDRLADEAWVSSEPTDSCAMIATAVCAAAGFSPDVRHHCMEWDSAGALVAAGAGVALIPRLAQPLRQADALVRCKVDGPPAARLLFVLARASAESSPPVMAVLDTVIEVAAERHDAI